MIVKKFRLQRSWSQEQLSHFSGLSIRTIQRIERGKPASMESLKALAAVFEVNVNDLKPESEMNSNNPNTLLTEEEADALEYVKGLKEFYMHAMTYVVTILFLIFVNWMTSSYLWVLWVIGGWGLGLLLHALSAFDWIHMFDPEWEKKQVEKRLGRKL